MESKRPESKCLSRPVRVVRVYCPVSTETLSAMLAGDVAAIDRDPVLGALLAVVRAGSPLGDFGIYKSVVELGGGWELFTPGDTAHPALGTAGAGQVSPTVVLTLHVADDAPAEALDRALDAIMAVHPWEVPVIEITPARLLLRR